MAAEKAGKQPTKKRNNVIAYRGAKKPKLIYFILAGVFLYLVVQVILFFLSDKIYTYEVGAQTQYSQGSLLQGVIVREETVYTTDSAGIINYYIASGRKMGKDDSVYTVDNNGEFAQQLEIARLDMELLSQDSLRQIKKELELMSANYQEQSFSDIYAEKAYLRAMILDAVNEEAMSKLDADLTVGFKKVTAAESGFLSLATDTYNNLTQEQINADVFDMENFSMNYVASGNEVQAGDFAYRLVKNDYFDLIFPMDESLAAQYSGESSMSVYLRDIDVTVSGDFLTFTAADGNTYGKISFNRYGSQVCNLRFLEFEILNDNVTGYKVPVSAVTAARCLKVPAEYCYSQSNDNYVFVSHAGEDASAYEKQTVYYADVERDDESNIIAYYVHSDELQAGDTVYNVVDGAVQSTYQLSEYTQFDGVYNVNRGYALFRAVNILAQTADKEYYIIKPNSIYGVSAYDFIVLDSTKVEQGDLVY